MLISIPNMNTLALLPNLAGGDGLLILLVVLVLFGAKKLPELAKGLGSAIREFSKAKDHIEHEFTSLPAPTQPVLNSDQGRDRSGNG
jgi:sec-independent protein translocase protein TatA